MFNELNEKVLKYGTAALLLVVPLYPKFPLFNIPGTYVAIRLEDFLIAFLALSLFLFNGKHILAFLKSPIGRALLLFLITGFVSLLSGILVTKTVSPHLGFLHWARRVEYIIPFFIAFWAIRKGNNTRFFVEVIFITVFVAFLYGAGQVYAGFPVISTQNEEFAKGLALQYVPGSRLHSTFAGHYDLAAFLVLAFPIVLSLFFVIKAWLYRGALLLGVAAPAFWLLMRTESRVSFAAYLLGIILTLWLVKKRLFIVPVVAVSILLMGTVGGLGERYLYTINVYKQKIMNGEFLNLAPSPVWAQENSAPARLNTMQERPEAPVVEDRSTSIRLNVEWPRAIRAFSKNPLLGTGYSSIGLATDNDYLRLLGEVGLIGFLAFWLVIARIFESLIGFFKRTKTLDLEKGFVAAFVGGFAGLLLNATFIDIFEASKVAIVFWTLAGIAIGIAYKGGYEKV